MNADENFIELAFFEDIELTIYMPEFQLSFHQYP